MPDSRAKADQHAFQKYDSRGAYHWGMLSRNPRKHHPFLAARYRICLDMLGDVAGKDVLDFGCGDGALAGLIAMGGGRVTGIDPSEAGLALARQEFARRGLKGCFFSSSHHLVGDHFDAVVCADVIEHVTDADSLLQEIRRVLKPGGLAVLSTPIRLTETPIDKEHVHEYQPSEFNTLCARYFDVIEIKQALSAGLHEMLYISGLPGRLLSLGLGALSAWLNWNYIIELKGKYRFYEIQFARLRRYEK